MEKQFVILSLKWSKFEGQLLVWYRPNAAGYTNYLHEAGIYTKEEAAKHEMKGITKAIPHAVAHEFAGYVVIKERLDQLLAKADLEATENNSKKGGITKASSPIKNPKC